MTVTLFPSCRLHATWRVGTISATDKLLGSRHNRQLFFAMATAFSLFLPPATIFHSSTRFPPPYSTHHRQNRRRRLEPRIPNTPFSSSSFRNGSTRPETDCPVPLEQQPVNEYDNLSSSFLFSWAAGDAVELGSRLLATGLSFALIIGLPVSWFGSGSGSAEPEPINLLLGSVSSGIFATILVVLRMYLGWAYVGNRLLSATVEYEETGWYDGQVWVKTPEVLTRDRLLGSFQGGREVAFYLELPFKSF